VEFASSNLHGSSWSQTLVACLVRAILKICSLRCQFNLSFDRWLVRALDMICHDTRMSDAHDTLGRSNFMNIAGLLVLVRGAKSLWTHNCGNSMSNGLSNSAFNDLPRDGTLMNCVCLNVFAACALNGLPQFRHTGVRLYTSGT